jgi:hypothetical protein
MLLLYRLNNLFGVDYAVAPREPMDLLNIKFEIRLDPVCDIGGSNDRIDVSGLPTDQHRDFHRIGL